MCTDRRAALLTDDVLVVESEGHCIGGSTELRLRAAAAPIVDDEPSHRVNTTADDRVAYAPSSVAAGPLPIGGIVLPAPSRAATNLEIQQLPASTALIALLACPRVHGWRVPTVIQRDFSTLSRIVNQVPVFSAVIPWGPPFHPFVAERLGVLIDPAA